MNPDAFKKLKVAIVHDWLIGGGAERVVWELHTIFPDAPIYTSACTPAWRQKFGDSVRTGYLNSALFVKLRKYIPVLRILWFTRLKLKGYDLIISSSGAEAKGVRVPKDTVHINYCHAPTHYYWNRYDQYLRQPGFGLFDPLARLGLKFLVGPLRKWDFKAAQRPHHIIANSSFTAEEVKTYYSRDATVIHPPVDIGRFASGVASEKRHGFVITGRQTPYKRVDLAVRACTQSNVPLKVIGRGPDHERLKSLAGPTITFLTDVSDEEMPGHLAGAAAFIFPAEDDFGISAVEAMAAGTPVIAYKSGGALDYVIDHDTGLFFTEQTVDSLSKVIAGFGANNFNQDSIKRKAAEFSPEIFREHIVAFIQQNMVK